MRGVAMADLHLGFCAFSREVGGRNAREQDVERAWAQAVENTVLRQPDLVTIAGDIFHHPRVSTHAVRAYRDGIRRIATETDAHVVILQGNHDAPRSTAGLSPIVIPDDYVRVHVVTKPVRLSLFIARTDEDVAVACFPFVAMGDGTAYKVEPDPDADVNVLLVHAAVKGDAEGDALPYFYGGLGALDVGREAERWDVVAVGDFHEHRMLHPSRLAFYSGSIERTSSNIWPESWPKGIVAYDTEAGTLELVEHPTRRVDDYVLGDFSSGSINDVDHFEVDHALSEIAEMDTSADAIVRLLVPNFPRAERDQIDWKLVRELKQRCFHFQLDLRYAKAGDIDVRDRRTGGAQSIEDAARAFFSTDSSGVREIAYRHLGIDQSVESAEVPELIGGGV